jgi:hypothetical protein
VTHLPAPPVVRKALGSNGAFEPAGFRFTNFGFEVFGRAVLNGRQTPVGMQFRRVQDARNWQIQNSQVSACWWPVRDEPADVPEARDTMDTLLQGLVESLSDVDWFQERLQLRAPPFRYWIFEEGHVHKELPPGMIEALDEEYGFDITLKLHANCRLRCLFCPRGHPPYARKIQDSDLALVKRLVREVFVPARERGLPVRVVIDAGDLAAHPHIEQIMELVFENCGCPMHLVVPGDRLADPAVAVRFASLPGLQKISVSIFGSSAATHDRIAGLDGSFANTIRALKHLSRLPVWLNCHFVPTACSLQEISGVIDVIQYFGADAMVRYPVSDCSAHDELLSELIPAPIDIRPILETLVERCTSTGGRITLADFPVCALPPALRHLKFDHQKRSALHGYPVLEPCVDCIHLKECIGVPVAWYVLQERPVLIPERDA